MKTVLNNAQDVSDLIDSWGKPGALEYPCSIDIKPISEKSARTIIQNNAMHKYFAMLSDNLNIVGLDVMQTMRADAEIPWTPELVKSLIWAVIQRAMFDTDSTTKLSTGDVGRIYDTIHRHMIEKHNVSVQFPDREQMRLNQIYGSKT